MIINYGKVALKPLLENVKLDLNSIDTSDNVSLKKIDEVDVEIETETIDNILYVYIYGEAKVQVECAYSLEIFPYSVQLDEELAFTRDPNLISEDIFYEQGPDILLDDYIYGLILGNLPLKIVKTGAKLPDFNVENVKLYSEKEFANEVLGLKLEEFDEE